MQEKNIKSPRAKAKDPSVTNTDGSVVPNEPPVPVSEIVVDPAPVEVEPIPEPVDPGKDKDKKEPVLPDNPSHEEKIKFNWEKLKRNDKEAHVSIPGSRRSVSFSHLEIDNRKVSIWTSSDQSLAPDFVIVNAPTELPHADGSLITDPLTIIAIAINGASN